MRVLNSLNFENIHRDKRHELIDVTYLDMSQGNLKDLQKVSFQNFAKLIHLDLSFNNLEDIVSSDFEGLVSLRHEG